MNIQDPEFYPDNYPIYLNPTFDEIVDLAKRKWDSIRILIINDSDICIASGYGNTHSSMVQCLRRIKGNRFSTDSYILYHENSLAYFNLEDVTGKRNATYRYWSECFNKDHIEIFRDLIRESDLSLA